MDEDPSEGSSSSEPPALASDDSESQQATRTRGAPSPCQESFDSESDSSSEEGTYVSRIFGVSRRRRKQMLRVLWWAGEPQEAEERQEALALRLQGQETMRGDQRQSRC